MRKAPQRLMMDRQMERVACGRAGTVVHECADPVVLDAAASRRTGSGSASGATPADALDLQDGYRFLVDFEQGGLPTLLMDEPELFEDFCVVTQSVLGAIQVDVTVEPTPVPRAPAEHTSVAR
jgi:hypothetical protein